jgi:putative Holliday junction resolvase
MALDIGERRIGIAISQSGVFASPHSVLHRKSKKDDFAHLQRLVEELNIEQIVIGIPYSLVDPGTEGPQARRIRRFARSLAQVIGVPIDFVNEAYSTADARMYLQQSGRDVAIDAAAAAVILQKYLDDLNLASF